VLIDLWNFKLGHPSHDRLHVMRQHYPILTVDKNFVCDTCHKAKQRKLDFPNSQSHASVAFSLLQVDIWGQENWIAKNIGYLVIICESDSKSILQLVTKVIMNHHPHLAIMNAIQKC